MPSTSLNPSDYTDRMKISFSGYNRGETLQDFPVLVKLSTGISGFNYSHFASGTGGDLRFTDSNGSRVIPHEIDEWNPGGTSIVWVQMPALTGTNDFIWAYWGNSSATTPPPGTNVWVPQSWEGVPSYDMVYHLKENGFPFADSTGVNPAVAGNPPTQAPGFVGTGQSFANAAYLVLGSNYVTSQFTVSAWVNLLSTDTAIQAIWASKVGGFSNPGFGLYVNDFSNPGNGEVELETGTGLAAVTSPAGACPLGSWHLVTAVIDVTGGVAHLYVDANNVGNGPIHTDMPLTNNVNLGSFVNGGNPFNGSIDEARIRFGTNSPNWVWASYMTVAQNSSLQSYSTVNSTVPNPITVQFQRSGGNLVLSGNAGAAYSNQTYRVLSTTNVALPLAQWTPVATNPFANDGSFSSSVPLDSTTKSQFFRVAIP
jgi:hypothetical protein